MPRHYSPAEKAAAMTRLIDNLGNIKLTALQLNIPVRTLRDWRQEEWLKQIVPPPPPPPTPPAGRQPEELPPFKDDLEAISFLRRQMLDELLAMSLQLRQDFAVATPYQRLMIIPQMLDRLMKLDQQLQPYLLKPEDYLLEDAEEFQPPPDSLEFTFLPVTYESTSFTADRVRLNVSDQLRFGTIPPIRVQYFRQRDNQELELQWTGIMTLSDAQGG